MRGLPDGYRQLYHATARRPLYPGRAQVDSGECCSCRNRGVRKGVEDFKRGLMKSSVGVLRDVTRRRKYNNLQREGCSKILESSKRDLVVIERELPINRVQGSIPYLGTALVPYMGTAG